MKADLDSVAVCIRAEQDRWMSLGEVIGFLIGVYRKSAPPIDHSRLSHWSGVTFHKGHKMGRPTKPGSKPRPSRASRKAAKLPHSPALAD